MAVHWEGGRSLQPRRAHSVPGRRPNELHAAGSGGLPQEWQARSGGSDTLWLCRAAGQWERHFPAAAELHTPPAALDRLRVCDRQPEPEWLSRYRCALHVPELRHALSWQWRRRLLRAYLRLPVPTGGRYC